MELQAPHTGRSTMDFLKDIWDTEGPLGIPMKDKQALQMEALLKDLPKDDLFKPGFLITEKATTELLPGERADVSWISWSSRHRSSCRVSVRSRSATTTICVQGSRQRWCRSRRSWKGCW